MCPIGPPERTSRRAGPDGSTDPAATLGTHDGGIDCHGSSGPSHYPDPVAVSRVIDRVGQVLGGRYRLLAPVGTGASASVYLADDVTLRRRVAVKILHDALA